MVTLILKLWHEVLNFIFYLQKPRKMKYCLNNLLTISSLIFLFSCEETKDLANIDFNTTVEKTLPVTASDTDEMSYSILLDATDDSQIDQYADKIVGYEVNALFIEVINYSATIEDEIYFNGKLGFSGKADSSPAETCEINNLNITHVANTGKFEINPCNSILADIAAMLTNENAVKVYLVGSFSKATLTFDLVITADVKVTANPL
jgi:hypothetical protein